MDVRLTGEQELLRTTVRTVADQWAATGPEELLRNAAGGWKRVVELGIPALRSPALAGVDASGVEVALVLEEVSRAVAPVPVLGQAVLAAEILEAAGATATLQAIADGDIRVAPALRRDLGGFAGPDDDGIVFDSADATHVLLVESVPNLGGARVLLRSATGATRAGLDLTRDWGEVPPVDPGEETLGLVDAERWIKVEALAFTALGADLLGVMQGALDDAVAYVAERRQFGVPVGSFQAVQHLAADALVQVEATRSCVWHAAWSVDHQAPTAARLAGRAAKAFASKAGRQVVETTVQLFGGIAITWEQLSHVRLRRALLDRQLFGDENLHYEQIAATRLADAGLS